MKKFILTLAATALATGSLLADHHEKLDAAKADIKIVISGNDTMKYDKESFEVTAGQIVALTLKNTGMLPVIAMGHNLVILKPGADIVKFAMAGIANKPGGHLPKEETLTKQIIINTKVLGPKEEETIVFKAGEAGEYPYLCTFPGHFGVMKGVMTVKKK